MEMLLYLFQGTANMADSKVRTMHLAKGKKVMVSLGSCEDASNLIFFECWPTTFQMRLTVEHPDCEEDTMKTKV